MLTLMFLTISGSSLIHLVIWLIIIGVIFWVLWWGVTAIGIPEPFNKVIRVILILVAVILLVNVLLGLIGEPFIRF